MRNLWGRTWSAVTHVVSVDDKAAATVEDVCFEVNGSSYLREKIIDQYFAIHLRHVALWISAVNLYFAKFYETLSEMSVNVWEQVRITDLIFLITLQVCKFLDVTFASPTPLIENPPTVAVIVVSSMDKTCVIADHMRPNKFPIYRAMKLNLKSGQRVLYGSP